MPMGNEFRRRHRKLIGEMQAELAQGLRRIVYSHVATPVGVCRYIGTELMPPEHEFSNGDRCQESNGWLVCVRKDEALRHHEIVAELEACAKGADDLTADLLRRAAQVIRNAG